MTPPEYSRPFGDDLKEVGQILGDPTRIDMLRFVMRSADPVTALDVSGAFGLHPNAARHHLAKLEAAGLILAKSRRNPAGGRPAKVYVPGSRGLQLHYPGRQYMLMSDLLLRALASSDKVGGSKIAEVAAESGKDLASDVLTGTPGDEDFGHQVERFLSVLEHLGYMTRATNQSEQEANIVNTNCIYADLGPKHGTKLCQVCHGLLSGVASEVGLKISGVSEERIVLKGEECRMTLTL